MTQSIHSEEVAVEISRSQKKKYWLLTLSSAVLFLLGLHPVNWTVVAWFGFLPLFLIWADPAYGRKQLVLASLIAGFAFWSVGLYWLLYYEVWVYLVALVMIGPALALYFFLVDIVVARLRPPILKILAASLVWVLLHRLYSLSPIGAIGMEAPFYAPLSMLQLVSVTGMMGLAFVILGLNASLAMALKGRFRSAVAGVLVFAGLLGAVHLWGSTKLMAAPTGIQPKLALIQHNLPMSGEIERPLFVRKEYRRLALEASEGEPDVLVFPLYNFPEDIYREPAFFSGLAQETGKHIWVASHIPQEPGGSFLEDGFLNVALLFDPEGKLVGKYQTVEAVPFGGLPEFTSEQYEVIETPFGKMGVLLCFEDTLPRLARTAVESGAEFLIALSNPGHFVTTHLPYYHLLQDQLRAIETGKWVLRVSANGYTAAIDPRGRIVARSELDNSQILFVQ